MWLLLGCTRWDVELEEEASDGAGETGSVAGDTDTGDTDTGEEPEHTGPRETDSDGTDSETGPPDETDTAGPDTGAPTAYAFAGTVRLVTTEDGVTACDIDANLRGTPYSGDCEDCDFEIAMETELTRDDSVGCTWSHPRYSWIEYGFVSDVTIAFAPFRDYLYYAAYQYYYDVEDLWFGYYHYDDGSTSGTYGGVSQFDYGGGTYGYLGMVRSGDELAWGLSVDFVSTYLAAYGYCDTIGYSYPSSAATTSQGSSSIMCDGSTVDIWTFTADGDTVTLTVDTTDASTTFDPFLMVLDEDGCGLYFQDDTFECTYPPPTWACPTAEASGLVTGGSYQAYIGSYGDCSTETVDYALLVDGGSWVSLAQDDLKSAYHRTVDIAGSGALLPI